MILLNRYLLIFFLSLSIISCGGSSSYPTTDTSSGGNDGGTTPNDPDSTSDVLSLDADCAYYGLAAATSNGQCLEYGSSTTFDLSDLSGGSQKTISSRFDVDDTSNGFAGANNVLQIAEAKALLTKLGIAHDGSSQNIAILGSGFNDVAAFNTSGKSYNYGYLNNSGDIKGASASGNIEFKTLYNNLEEVEKYSIFTKNTFEAFSPEQDFTSSNSANFYYDDNTQPVLNSSKAKISSSQIATYIYDVSSTDTDVVFASNHITSLANYFDDKQGTFGTGTGVLDYDNVLNQNDEALCASNDCTRNYHVFLSEDYSGSFYEYQTSIFEYGHNDVANGSALASIIGATDSSNIQGQATGAIMNSYKTQIYHRKLLDVSSGSFISNKNKDYMDSILEDNTGTILYNALNDARQNNKIILLNNQYRNYKSQFYINTDAVSIEAKTNFQLSYDTATDPSQLDGYTEVDFYRFSNNTNYSLNSYSVSKDEDIGTFVGGNFVDSSTKNLVNNDISSYNSLTDYDIFKKSNHDYGDSGTYKYLTDTNLNTAATTSVNNIKDLINSNSNGVNNIYIIPTDNKFFIDLVNVLSTDYNQVKNLITVSDVQVKDITYAENDSIDYDNDNEEDYNGLYEIDSIEVDSKISDNDCSVITNSNTACFIAPGNVASLNNSGEYTAYDDLDIDGVNKYQNTNVLNNHGAKDGIDQGEYLGSAYVTSAVAILTGAFPSVELYNIVTKLKDTAISASDIRGCDEDGESGTINCGNGMINLFKAVQPLYSESQTSSAFSHIDSPAIHTNSVVDDFVYDLADTSISSSLYFGDALINNTEDIFAKAQYFDSYNFNYNASLASKVSASKDLLVSRYAASDLFEFDNKFETKSENIPLANNISFTVTSTKLKNNDVSKVVRVFEDPEIEIANAEFSNLKFNQTIYQNVDIEFGFDSYSNEFDIINNN
ncbi:MAG: hypothetical protein ISQ32_04935, partial [Rickettsiales bacterium]|nr:hypothetical protein [Rickettsiales bacterium]